MSGRLAADGAAAVDAVQVPRGDYEGKLLLIIGWASPASRSGSVALVAVPILGIRPADRTVLAETSFGLRLRSGRKPVPEGQGQLAANHEGVADPGSLVV